MERLTRNLVFGASGLVGQSFLDALPPEETQGYCFSKKENSLKSLDILDTRVLSEEIEKLKPQTIFWAVNFGGGVNRCEYSPIQARAFHLESTKVVVDLCKKHSIRFVFISTDYVFSDSPAKKSESDPTYPLNLYGQLKLSAENYIRNNINQYIIARTTNVYGWDEKTRTPNFYMQVYRKLNENKEVHIPEALKGNPTYVEDLTNTILELLQNEKYGTFHIVGPENLSRVEWAKKIAKSVGKKPEMIKSISSFVNTPQRPLNLELSTEKVRQALPIKLISVESV